MANGWDLGYIPNDIFTSRIYMSSGTFFVFSAHDSEKNELVVILKVCL